MEADGASSGSARLDEPTRRRMLAQFVRTGRIAPSSGLRTGLAGRLPALVHQVVHQPGLRTPYPLVLDPSADPALAPLSAYLTGKVEALGGEGEEADLNRHFAQRIESVLRQEDLQAIAMTDAWKTARSVVSSQLRSNRTAAFEAFAGAMERQIPKAARLLPCESSTVSAYARLLADRQAAGRAQSLLADAARLRASLGSLLDVEREETTVAPERLRNAVGGALTDAFDFNALSHLLEDAPHAAGMDPERKERIESLVAVLDRAASVFEPVSTSLGKAQEAMATMTNRYVELLRTLEAARLEAMNRFRPETHPELLDSFVAEALSLDDLASCPAVLVSVDGGSMSAADVAKVLELSADRRPFAVLLTLRGTVGVPGNLAASLPGSAVAMGTANVLQAALSDVEHWMAGLEKVLSSSRSSLVAVYAGPASSLPYMTAAVARDGRAVPGFLFFPEPDAPWADRMSVASNETPETDWPMGRLSFEEPDGSEVEKEVGFTWLDYAATEPAFEDGFLTLSAHNEVETLVPADVYLGMGEDDQARAIPFIWTVSEDGILEKTVVSGALLERARSALDRWHRLRELGGVNNSYAANASKEAARRFAAERDEAIAEAERRHAAEMDRAVGALAESIVSNIAAGLLDLEGGAPAITRTVAPAAPKTKTAAASETNVSEPETTAEPAPSEPEEDALSLDEAYIETPRCTACNECTNLNKMIFAYNGEKQAYIKDASAGPYRDIVTAAEKCPVRIIHPGKPTNPSEQGLDDLIERAKPFL